MRVKLKRRPLIGERALQDKNKTPTHDPVPSNISKEGVRQEYRSISGSLKLRGWKGSG